MTPFILIIIFLTAALGIPLILPCPPGSFHDDCLTKCLLCPNGTTSASAELGDRIFTLGNPASMSGAKFINFDEPQPTSDGFVHFDGVDDFVELIPWEFGGGAFSFEVSVKYEYFNEWSRIIHLGSGFGVDNVLMCNSGTSTGLWVHYFDESGESLLEVPNFFHAGEFVHIVWSVSDTGAFSIYRNGRLRVASDPTGNVPKKTTRANHWIGQSANSGDAGEYFHGTIQSIAVYGRALTLTDQFSDNTIFNIGLMGAITLTAGCSKCPPTLNCSEVVCPASTSAHLFTELGGLVCPPCLPNSDANGNQEAYVECTQCPAEGCAEHSQTKPGTWETLAFLAVVISIAVYKGWKRFRRRSRTSVEENAPHSCKPNEGISLKGKSSRWYIDLNAFNQDGAAVRLNWASLRFEDEETEVMYAEDVWHTERRAAQQLVSVVMATLGTMLLVFVAFYFFMLGQFSSGFVLLGMFAVLVLFFIDHLLANISKQRFQLVMVGFQGTIFAAALFVTASRTQMAFRALCYVAITQPATILLLVSSSSIFKLRWAYSCASCLFFGVILYLVSQLYVRNGGPSFDLGSLNYHIMFEPPILIMVGVLVPQTLRQTDIARRTAWVISWLNAKKLQKQNTKIQFQAKRIESVRGHNIRMQEQLLAARSTIASVMEDSKLLLKQYEILASDIVREGIIGEGSFGSVFKGTLRGTTTVAIKTMRVSKINESEVHKFKRELITMCQLKHVNLVHLYGGVWNEGADKLCIVLEFCQYGSLKSFLGGGKRGTWEELYYGLALGTAQGLTYLHHDLNEPLIHRDLKPDNILVGESVVAKVADFGESRNFDQKMANQRKCSLIEEENDNALTMTMVGTKLFCAPEISAGQRYNESADTFSFALVLLCLASGNILYLQQHCHSHTRHLNYEDGQRPPIPPNVYESIPAIARLIQDMWQGNFRLRPTMRCVTNTLINMAPPNFVLNCRAEKLTRKTSESTKIVDDAVLLKAQKYHSGSDKTHAAFLSHHKEACATEARLVKDKYEALLGVECFLGRCCDSDNLRDLRGLVSHVKDSDALVLFQSKGVLCRPWCLIELNAAIDHGVPIVALNCKGKGYDFVEADDFMLHLESSLKTLNPGALNVLKKNGIDPERLAYKLSSVLPNIISIPLNTSASENAVKASMVDLLVAVTSAKPMPIDESFEDWCDCRKAKERIELEQVLDYGTIRGTQRGRMLERVERAAELAVELQREREMLTECREMITKLMAKNEKLEAKVEKLEGKLGY